MMAKQSKSLCSPSAQASLTSAQSSAHTHAMPFSLFYLTTHRDRMGSQTQAAKPSLQVGKGQSVTQSSGGCVAALPLVA